MPGGGVTLRQVLEDPNPEVSDSQSLVFFRRPSSQQSTELKSLSRTD